MLAAGRLRKSKPLSPWRPRDPPGWGRRRGPPQRCRVLQMNLPRCPSLYHLRHSMLLCLMTLLFAGSCRQPGARHSRMSVTNTRFARTVSFVVSGLLSKGPVSSSTCGCRTLIGGASNLMPKAVAQARALSARCRATTAVRTSRRGIPGPLLRSPPTTALRCTEINGMNQERVYSLVSHTMKEVSCGWRTHLADTFGSMLGQSLAHQCCGSQL